MLKMVLNKERFYLLLYLPFTWMAYLHVWETVVLGTILVITLLEDLKLLVPSNKGLQNLVYTYEDYAQEFDITFNGA